MKQPRVPEYREGDSVSKYIKNLILFLKDFSMSVWRETQNAAKEIEGIAYPVTSVNGKTGEVKLAAADVGALASSYKSTVDSLNKRWNVKINANACANVDNPVETGFHHCGSSTTGSKPSTHGELLHITETPNYSEHQLFFPSGGGLWHRHRNNDNTPNSKTWKNWQAYKPILETYPVGAIYMSVSSTSPASLFGGTWTQLKDRFLIGAGGSYAVNATGGAATHTLTANEMPVHSHNTVFYNDDFSNVGDGANIDQKKESAGLTYDSAYLKGAWNKTTQNTGGGKAHNNMPPYLAVYMWKRTA